MLSDQWMAMWKETTAAWDWTDYLKNVEQWSMQGMDLWKEMQVFVQSSAPPQAWFEAASAITEAWDTAIQGWGPAKTPDEREAEEQAMIQLERERDEAQQELAAQKKEVIRLKRSLAQKERSLNQSKKTVARQRTDINDRNKQIKVLEKKVAHQAERLLLRESQINTTPAPPKAPAKAAGRGRQVAAPETP